MGIVESRTKQMKEALYDIKKHTNVLALLELSTIINASYDLNFILGTVLRTIMGRFMISRGMVFLASNPTEFKVYCVKGISEKYVGETICISRKFKTVTYLETIRSSNASWYNYLKNKKQDVIYPIFGNKECIGFATLGKRYGKQNKYSVIEAQWIMTILNLSASAIEKARLIDELNSTNNTLACKIQELKTLFELSKEFNIGIDAHQVLRLLTFALLGHMGVQRYVVCVIQNKSLAIIESKGIDVHAAEKHLLSLCDLTEPIILIHNRSKKKYKKHINGLLRLGITVVVPMLLQNKVNGFLCLGENIKKRIYDETDLEFLSSLGSLATMTLENTRLMQEALEKQRIEDEIQIAREIQKGLFPRHLPKRKQFEIAAITIPSKEVGGDYYDVVALKDDRYLLAIGDVAGKGIPASLLMANLQAALRTVAQMELSINEMVTRLNSIVCDNTYCSTKFITFFAGILDLRSNTFTYTNAGHNTPFILRSNGECVFLSEGGMVLGIFEHSHYNETSVSIGSGDILVLYTDGISEAMNATNQEFTEEQLVEIVRTNASCTPNNIVKTIQLAVLKHSENTPQIDDITLLILKVA